MNAMIASLLRSVGIDPDHPEQFIDKLLSTFGVTSEQVKQTVMGWQEKIEGFDQRQSAMLAKIEGLEAKFASLEQRLKDDDQ